MKSLFAALALILLPALGAMADGTNELSDKEIQGQALAQKILAQWPAHDFTNSGVIKIRNPKGLTTNIPVQFSIHLYETNWATIYQTTSNSPGTFLVITRDREKNDYWLAQNISDVPDPSSHIMRGNEAAIPFLGSDFTLADLGLEFFHWPQQKVLKREVHSSRGCTVLESVNPDATTNGYSRVMAWIDTETLGIVEAYAYDAKGKLLKDFYPKDFKKVDGQWQVQTFVMENVQTGSRSRLEFDLKK